MITYGMNKDMRPIMWFRAARNVYETFPVAVRDHVNTALTIAQKAEKRTLRSR